MITFREQALEILAELYPFNRLENPLLEQIVDRNPIRRLKKGKMLYDMGDEATALYVVIQGTVGLNSLDEQAHTYPLMALNAGDLFGFEAIQEDTYETQAIAWSDSLVLEITYDVLEQIALMSPAFRKSILFLVNSLLRSSHAYFPWRNLEENILYANRRHWVFMLLRLFIPILLLLALIPLITFFIASRQATLVPVVVSALGLLMISAYSLWVILDWRNDYTVITNQRVVWQEKVILLYESRQEAPLDSVLAVSVHTSALGRIFDYGNVVVRTYAGVITLLQVPEPQEVAALLESQWAQAKRGMVRAEQFARVEQMIRERLFHSAETRQVAIPEAAPIQSQQPEVRHGRGLFDWLADVFQLRVQTGGMIQYRTHWWILIQRTFLSFLVLMLAAVFGILNLSGVLPLLSTPALLWIPLGLGVVFGGIFIYQVVDWRNDLYIVTNEYLIDVNKKPLGLEQKRTAPLKTVQSVEFERVGLAGLLLNFGTVSIRVGETTLTFDFVYNPAEVQRELFKRITEKERALKQKEIEADEQRLTDWIEVYHHLHEQQDRNHTENL